MNHLELVNKVLVRLRENKVSTVNQTPYSSLISELVNEAKNLVEDAWDWTNLRTTLSGTTTEGVFSYEIEGASTRFKMLDVVNDTSNQFMHLTSSTEFNDLFLNTDQVTVGEPLKYSYNGVSEDNNLMVDVWPVPDGAYELRFNGVKRSGDLVADSDKLFVPETPVALLAYAYAVDERGEDMGQASTYAHQRAKSALSDAIAFDVARYPDEITWRTC